MKLAKCVAFLPSLDIISVDRYMGDSKATVASPATDDDKLKCVE